MRSCFNKTRTFENLRRPEDVMKMSDEEITRVREFLGELMMHTKFNPDVEAILMYNLDEFRLALKELTYLKKTFIKVTLQLEKFLIYHCMLNEAPASAVTMEQHPDSQGGDFLRDPQRSKLREVGTHPGGSFRGPSLVQSV